MCSAQTRLLLALLGGCAVVSSAWAGGTLTDAPVPLLPSQAQVEEGTEQLGNPINKPVTGAAEAPRIVGGERPPSLEQLQATRPGDVQKDGLEAGRGEVLRQAALTYGAQGGLAGRAFAINEMLRRHEAQLDGTFDFRPLVVALGGGQTLMRPPIVTEAQMAFALGESGQVARETGCIYEITREAPLRPAEAALPRTKTEVAYWNKWVVEGWAAGERQAVEIFLSDLGRLERDIVGMARYQVLLRAGLVEAPKVTFQDRGVDGGRDALHIDDRTVRITDQPGLQADRSRWQPGSPCAR
jgi:defect-in-organelle-trafficking protein DotC